MNNAWMSYIKCRMKYLLHDEMICYGTPFISTSNNIVLRRPSFMTRSCSACNHAGGSARQAIPRAGNWRERWPARCLLMTHGDCGDRSADCHIRARLAPARTRGSCSLSARAQVESAASSRPPGPWDESQLARRPAATHKKHTKILYTISVHEIRRCTNDNCNLHDKYHILCFLSFHKIFYG